MILACSILLLSVFSVPISAESEQQFGELQQCDLANGQSIRLCRIAYRSFGELSQSRDNIIIFPTWFTGTSSNLIDYDLIGPGKLVDTNHFHVIAIDALADGVSSSPSNWTAEKSGMFPEITIGDMVKAEHALLKNILNISHVHAVIGISMGGMQTFQWVSQYPDFMDYAVAMDGSPKMTSYDILQWQSHREVIQTLQQHNVPNPKIMELVNLLGMLTAWTPDYFVENIPAEDIAKFIHEEQANQAGTHPDDYVAQLSAMINHDIYTASGKSEQQMASFIKADMLVVSVSSDHMVNPATALKLANALGAEKLVLDSNCGHLGTTCELDHVAARVKNFLNKPAKRIAKVP